MSERDQSSWNEQKLDALLSDFFEREMPEDIKNPTAPLKGIAADSPLRKRQRQSGLLSIFATTALLMVIVSLVWNPFENSENSVQDVRTHQRSPISHSSNLKRSGEFRLDFSATTQPAVNFSDFIFHASKNSFEYTETVSETVEPIETPDGPVEMRNTMYISKKTEIDPQTGTAVKLEIPELEIEIQPDVFDEE